MIAVCVVSGIVLISAGTVGLGAVVSAHPGIVSVAKIVGGVYLVVLGGFAARRAWRPTASSTANDDPSRNRGLWAALGTALALTWLNPHTYLDTVLTLGSIANSHADAKWAFTIGACVASIVWFLALGFGAKKMAPMFSSVRAGGSSTPSSPSSWSSRRQRHRDELTVPTFRLHSVRSGAVDCERALLLLEQACESKVSRRGLRLTPFAQGAADSGSAPSNILGSGRLEDKGATDMPLPAQMDTRPRDPGRWEISFASVPTMRPPVAPNG